jgi:hypothetical protein
LLTPGLGSSVGLSDPHENPCNGNREPIDQKGGVLALSITKTVVAAAVVAAAGSVAANAGTHEGQSKFKSQNCSGVHQAKDCAAVRKGR